MDDSVFLVRSKADAEGLLYELIGECVFGGRPVGFDTETLGCNPKTESPVGRARIWCATFAWGAPSQQTPSPFRRAFVLREYLDVLKPFLENHRYPKVGNNLHGFDRHACWNEGIELRGIEGCVSAQSRLLNPSKIIRHGLKSWGEELGYEVVEFEDVCTVPEPMNVRKEWQYVCNVCGTDYPRVRKWCATCKPRVLVDHRVLCEHQAFKWTTKPLDELWEKYPAKRAAIVRYATVDAAMALDAYWVLRRRLEAVPW